MFPKEKPKEREKKSLQEIPCGSESRLNQAFNWGVESSHKLIQKRTRPSSNNRLFPLSLLSPLTTLGSTNDKTNLYKFIKRLQCIKGIPVTSWIAIKIYGNPYKVLRILIASCINLRLLK